MVAAANLDLNLGEPRLLAAGVLKLFWRNNRKKSPKWALARHRPQLQSAITTRFIQS
jgi:hypothetical protein